MCHLLQVIFHMQTCEPAVLPPLHELFEDSCDAISSRPIHMGCDISWPKLDVRLHTLRLAIADYSPAIRLYYASIMHVAMRQ